jgi:uncharacterized protein (DUF952 family)
MSPITICGKSTRVVDADGFTIDELAGNVASNDDTISIALVNAPKGTSEPWLTLHYDEWICVLEGHMVFSLEGLPDVEARGGQTIKINSGTRFKPSFPTADTRYVPVCLPAFTPERCIREEGKRDVASHLSELHERKETEEAAGGSNPEAGGAETLYHMTTAVEWAACQEYGCYYPKTFEKDGNYTHATAVPQRLIETANHFYQETKGDWICIEFKRSSLRQCGIFVRDEEALPVGDQAVSAEWVEKKWICPHVIGGLPVSVVTKIYSMQREGKVFLGIDGL